MSSEKRGFEPINLLFGLLMGMADIVPGISGGTVALILGIYERLVASIGHAAASAAYLLRGWPRKAQQSFLSVEWGLVLPLVLGIFTAVILGARLLVPLLEAHVVLFYALFFGLIAASVRVPWGRIRERRGSHYVIAGLGGIASLLIVGLPPGEVVDPSLMVTFLAAAVAICAMVLPGVSGSFLLLVMGMYTPTLRALNDLDFLYISVFIAGCLVGLGTFSRLLSRLFAVNHDVTMAALVGLMVGSLRALWPYQDASRTLLAPPSLGSFLVSLLLASIGFGVVFALTRFGLRIERQERERLAGVDRGRERS